jgi:hypothetical protein
MSGGIVALQTFSNYTAWFANWTVKVVVVIATNTNWVRTAYCASLNPEDCGWSIFSTSFARIEAVESCKVKAWVAFETVGGRVAGQASENRAHFALVIHCAQVETIEALITNSPIETTDTFWYGISTLLAPSSSHIKLRGTNNACTVEGKYSNVTWSITNIEFLCSTTWE